MSEGQPGGSAKERRAEKNRNYIAKIKTYGTRADRKAHAIATGKPRRPRRPQNVAPNQHQRDINYISRHIADAQARYTKDPSDKNHQHLMMYTNKLTNVVHQDDAHAPTHSTTEHVKKRSKKSKAARERAEEHRLFKENNPLTPEAKMKKAAESKARRDEAGGDKAYKLLQKERNAAAKLARDEEAQHAEIVRHSRSMGVDLPLEGPVKWGRAQGGQEQFRGVPNAYAID